MNKFEDAAASLASFVERKKKKDAEALDQERQERDLALDEASYRMLRHETEHPRKSGGNLFVNINIQLPEKRNK